MLRQRERKGNVVLHEDIVAGINPQVRIADDSGEMDGAVFRGAIRNAAAALNDAQPAPWEPVIVPISNRGADLASLIAVLQAGCVAVPLHRNAAATTRQAAFDLVKPRFSLELSEAGPTLTQLADAPPPARPLLESAALVVFTSGSTGAPKGVVVGAGQFRAKLAQIEARLGWRRGMRVFAPLQLTFVFGQWVSFLTLITGGSLQLSSRFDPAATLARLRAGEITGLAAVPTMLRALLAERGAPIARPFLLVTGGETLSPAVGATLGEAFPAARIADLYGLSETTSCDFFNEGAAFTAQLGTIGRPGPGVEAQVDAATGELLIRTPYLMKGYLDRPDLTQAALSGGWFRTGDMAEIAPSGAVRLIGRLKELINRGGNKVAPMEVEGVFAAHPAVRVCLATGAADAQRGEAIHLVVVSTGPNRPDPAELRDWARGRLEPWKLPDHIHFAEAIPLGATGKADRLALRRMIETGALD
ncbi:MAG: fatty acid--CoA ligase family protein [Paracoccaceae bacterium]